MANIAVELKQAVAHRDLHGLAGDTSERLLARSTGFVVTDVLCTSGPQDRAFEERHSHISIAMVVAGTFQYRNQTGKAMLTPGSLLLGDAGACFECGHEHGVGDRCIAFKFEQEYFARLAADSGLNPKLGIPRLPALRESSPLFVEACVGIAKDRTVDWEELGIRLALCVLRLANGSNKRCCELQPSSIARITNAIRFIEENSHTELSISELARIARLSPYHFLRVFQEQTGLTPHQFILRTRLRNAATSLAAADHKILDVALDCGFGDVSNFNRAFRMEFGTNPRSLRNRFHV